MTYATCPFTVNENPEALSADHVRVGRAAHPTYDRTLDTENAEAM